MLELLKFFFLEESFQLAAVFPLSVDIKKSLLLYRDVFFPMAEPVVKGWIRTLWFIFLYSCDSRALVRQAFDCFVWIGL